MKMQGILKSVGQMIQLKKIPVEDFWAWAWKEGQSLGHQAKEFGPRVL